MSAERPTMETGKLQGSLRAIPDAFRKAIDDIKPDGLDWQRIESAMDVLMGEKIAVTPKPPEPEPTESQKFWRDMYRSGKLTPYQKDRPGVSWEAIKMAWNDPQTQNETSKIMAVDMAIRGGADKEYNQLGDIKRRATRAAVMVGNMVPNIAFDIVSSVPPNLLEKGWDEYLKKDLAILNDQAKKELATRAKVAGKKADSRESGPEVRAQMVDKVTISPELKLKIDSLTSKVGGVRMLGRIGEVWNDKNVTALGNTIQRRFTGEKGWFTGEASDKLNDLLTAGFRDKAEDFINGPTLESAFRIFYQFPIIGAAVEQVWTRWTNFQSTNEYSKGMLKGIYTGIGIFIGILRDVDGKGHHTPSWKITDKIWDNWPWLQQKVLGENYSPMISESVSE